MTMLHEFLTTHTDEIIASARAKVAERTSPMPNTEAMKNGVPLFLGQLIDRLRLATTDSGAIEESATLHGGELLGMGFTVSQVVNGYGDVCQAVTGLADELDAPITPGEFHTFNRCLDDAIAHAVSAYQGQRDASVAFEGTERLAMFAHELRNRLSAAMLAFTILQEGTVGVGGSTGAVLGRSLRGLRDLVNNALAGVRLDAGLGHHHRVSMADVVGDVEIEASLEAAACGAELAVAAVETGVDVEADPQILAAALANLLQNAFKFSRRHGLISLRTSSTDERVRIEVEDECGGLPPGKAEELFLPFSQRSANRSGVGLGLSISRKGVEAMGGTIGVRDLPGKGCVFCIDLPRLPAA